MECLQNRVDSFAKAVRVPNPNKKNTFKNLKWPHPTSFLANPTTLAEAGFYYNPSHEDRDSVTCFVCEKQLSDWEAEDDPFSIHWSKCGDTCYWASLRCGLRDDMDAQGRFVFPDKSRIPSSKSMEKIRLQSFTAGDGWIHDKTRNHGASSKKKMAKACFVFTPQHSEDDLATCLYCGISLSSWDSGDDPLKEHHKRKGDVCPFFGPLSDSNPKSRSVSASKPSSRTSTTATGRSRTRSQSRAGMPGSQLEEEEEEEEPPSSAATIIATTKGRSATTRKASRARKTVAPVEEEEEAPVQQSSQTEPSARARKSEKPRSLSRSTNRKPTVTRSRKTIAAVEEEDEHSQEKPVLEEVAPKKSTASRKTSRTRKTGAAAPPPVEEDTDADEAEGSEPTKPSRKRKLRSKSVSRKTQQAAARTPSPPNKPTELEERDEEMEDLVLTKKARKTQAKAPETRPIDKETTENEEITGDDEGMQERAASKEDGSETQVEIGEDEEEAGVLKKSRKEKKVKTKQVEEEAIEETSVSKKTGKSMVKSPYVEDSGSEEVQGVSQTLETLEQAQITEDWKMEELPIPKGGNKIRTTTGGKRTTERTDTEVHKEEELNLKKTAKGKNEDHSEAEDETETQVEETGVQSKINNQPQKPAQGDLQDHKKSKTRRPRPAPSSDAESEDDEQEVAFMALDPEHRRAGTVPVPPVSAKLPSPSLLPTEVEPKTPIRPQHRLRFPDPASAVQSADIRTAQRGNRTSDLSTKPPSTDVVTSSSTSNAPAGNRLELESKESSSELGLKPEPKAVPEFTPFLSKLPFTPLHALSEAELDMTVEEWIRYQIDVEYDKFKRDGERELVRFRKRAEEVRKVIEGL